MNIIIVFTPFQAISAKAVIDSKVLNGEIRVFCFLPESSWARELLGDNAEFLSGTTNPTGMVALRIFRKTFAKIVASGEEITAVIAHPFHPAANFLMFSNLVSRRYMMPDGTANYCHWNIDSSLRRKMLVRKAAAALCGIPYTMYSGHIVGHETGFFDGAFTFQEKGMTTTSYQTFTINISKSLIAPACLQRAVMLLDQDIESLVSEKAANELRRRMWNYIDGLGENIIYYKGHYTQKVVRRINTSGKKIVELNKNTPAELLLGEICPSHVISFVSSALIHAKLSSPDIHAVSIGAAEIERAHQPHARGLKDMMKLFEVEMM